jgi:hypothetical protein
MAAVLAAAIALLVLAAPAAAEVRSGEATAAASEEIPAEADVIAATARYDSVAGSVIFAITTVKAPGINPLDLLSASLGTADGKCDLPTMSLLWTYGGPVATWAAREREGELVPFEIAERTTIGNVTTLSVTSPRLVGKPYDCAEAIVTEQLEPIEPGEERAEVNGLRFPINGPPTVTPPVEATPPVTTAPKPTTPKPAALTMAAPKPLKLRVGKWARVKVEVSDPGGAATTAIALKAKAPKGVVLKPASGKLELGPLQAGETRTVTLHAKLTEAAKASSTVSLTVTAAALAAKALFRIRAWPSAPKSS